MFQGRNPMFQVLRMEVHDTIQEAVIKTIPKKKKCKGQNALILHYCTIALISHASEVMLKMLQARLKHCENQEFIHVQAGFRKGRGTKDQIANIQWIIDKARVPEKLLVYWLWPSLWLCGPQQTVENSSRDGSIRSPYLPPEKSVYRSRRNS